MKYFKKSKYIIIENSKTLENFTQNFIDLQFKQYNTGLEVINNSRKKFFSEERLEPIFLKEKEQKVFLNSSQNPLINKNIFKTKIINYLTIKGKKQTAYRIYNNTFKLFFSFFETYNQELSENYPLYNTYYQYSLKNKLIFYEPLFIFYNLVSFLQPSFVLTVKKILKKKKQSKKPKELIINYIKPQSRFYFCVKSIVKYSKSFLFNKIEQKMSFSLLNLFLQNKNSFLYKKKLTAYNRIIKLRKIK